MGKVLISPSLLLRDLELGLPSCHTEWFSLSLQLTNSINIYENINCALLLTHLLWFHTFLSTTHLDLNHYPENRAQGQNHEEAQSLN